MVALLCTQLGHVALVTDTSVPPHPVLVSSSSFRPVMQAGTAVLTACSLTIVLTYLVFHRAVRVGRKAWHMTVNVSAHTALSAAVFTAGVERTDHTALCQAVGMVLHYATLATVLWLGLLARNLYKQLPPGSPRPPRGPAGVRGRGGGDEEDDDDDEEEEEAPLPRPMLRFYLIGGGIPVIVCGITAAANIHNYGASEHAPYCWMALEPSLGALFGPAAFVALVGAVYLSCLAARLRRRSPAQRTGTTTTTGNATTTATRHRHHRRHRHRDGDGDDGNRLEQPPPPGTVTSPSPPSPRRRRRRRRRFW
ncbi:adhesion G protein-coupled receptor A1-like [Lampetra planeri]